MGEFNIAMVAVVVAVFIVPMFFYRIAEPKRGSNLEWNIST